MAERADRIAAFLDAHGWEAARRVSLAGDASARRYLRLERGGERAILMDAPPDVCGTQSPFLNLAPAFRAAGLSPPRCIAWDLDDGLILMEDLGDDVFARLIEADAGMQSELYAAATDALVALQAMDPPPGLPRYGPREMALALRPAWTAYLDRPDPGTSHAWRRIEDGMFDILAANDMDPVIIHRDYHAENLVWLPGRAGLAKLGVLDFQDAMLGHPAYDLVSLVQDARRDVPDAVADAMIDRFGRARGISDARLRAACAVQGAQRHIRILGIFAHLAAARGKPGYLRLLPRVWRDLLRCLAAPVMLPLRADILDLLPPPADAP